MFRCFSGAATDLSRCWFACLLFVGIAFQVAAQSNQTIYDDALQNGWLNYGWATINYNYNSNPAFIHSGSKSISVTITDSSYQAIYIDHPAFDSTPYGNLTFWINGGTNGGQQLHVNALLNGAAQADVPLPVLTANTWQQIKISLSTLGVAGKTNFTGFWIQDSVGSPKPTFFVDDITLTTNSGPLPTITLNAPVNGTNFLNPANITLVATVVTNGHTINKVQFYNGATLLAEDTAPPYNFTWNGVGIGLYSLIARVDYDLGSAAGDTVDSAPANIRVVTNMTATIAVDAQKNRLPISPLIYGVAFATSNQLVELNAPLNRSGGNAETRYNWELNAHNRGADFFFESIGDAPGAVPGGDADDFIDASKSAGSEPVITVPMIGWAPKLAANRDKLASYSIAKYGPQTANDGDAGNGISVTNNTPITWNDPNDANFATNSLFQQQWIRHLTNQWGLSSNNGVRYYCMDNEHSIWHSTHQDVHPVGATMQEIRDKFFDYAGKVKEVDPNALVLAPEEWGWNGYFWSGFDQQWSGANHDYNLADFPDRTTNGGWDYLPWFLDQVRQHDASAGFRLLDVFSVHCYPQGGEFSDDVSLATQLRRNQSTREFWDTSYVDQTWINAVVKLIPRMKGWVASYYPGTKIGVTEYNWGAEGHINGATAQADILGIFGREGLDVATRWTTPDENSPVFNAMKMYRNYDGNKSGFGDISVSASSPNPDTVSTFAAVRSSDGALTLMAINKQQLANAATIVNVSGFMHGGVAQVWQLNEANAIEHLSDINFVGTNFNTTVPAQSIQLFVLPGGNPPDLRSAGMSSSTTFSFWLDGQVGLRYAILSSSNLLNWQAIQTNTPATSSTQISVPVGNSVQFYRAQWLP
jgi:hypothetical protein